MFHLTKLDTDLVASGLSRDPLGLQPVWSHFGRALIPSLTTVSTRAHHFSLLLLSLCCRDRWLEDNPGTELGGVEPLLVFEELHAYSLCATGRGLGDTPGKHRAKANWSEWEKDPWVSPWPNEQILRNQAGVGISGRYFTPLVRMDIVDDNGRLTDEVVAEELFGKAVIKVKDGVSTVLRLIEGSGKAQCFTTFPTKARKQIAKLLPKNGRASAELRGFWRQRIGIDGDNHPLVRMSAELLAELDEDSPAPAHVITALRGRDDLTTEQRAIVDRIAACEAFIAPLQKLFDQLYASDTIARFEAADHTSAWWNRVRAARPDFAALPITGNSLGKRVASLLTIQSDASVTVLVKSMLEHHRLVAEGKGGASWLSLEGERLHLLNSAYRTTDWDENGWVNGYYIPSLRGVLTGLGSEAAA